MARVRSAAVHRCTMRVRRCTTMRCGASGRAAPPRKREERPEASGHCSVSRDSRESAGLPRAWHDSCVLTVRWINADLSATHTMSPEYGHLGQWRPPKRPSGLFRGTPFCFWGKRKRWTKPAGSIFSACARHDEQQRKNRVPLLRRWLRHGSARRGRPGRQDLGRQGAPGELRTAVHEGLVGACRFAQVGPSRKRLHAPRTRSGPGAAADGAGDHRHRRSACAALLDAHGPDALSFYVSGQMSIEAQYLVNKLAKGFVGTNNIESNSRLCMASAGSGYKLSLGADGPPGSYQDFDKADLFFVIGANMADCHPILFLRMMDRVKAGAKLIVVDPRRNTTADKAEPLPADQARHRPRVAQRPAASAAQERPYGCGFHRRRSPKAGTGCRPFWRTTRRTRSRRSPASPRRISAQAAQWIGAAPEWMSCWTMGLNQSTHGTWNTNAICNLHLATGKICRRGSGPFSLTGQPNAMGGREMGYMGPGFAGPAFGAGRRRTARLSRTCGAFRRAR